MLEKIQERDLPAVDIVMARSEPKQNAGLRPSSKEYRRKGEGRAKFQPRITIERDQDIFRFSALTEAAVIPVREIEIQSFYPDSISQQLMDSTYPAEQERLGRLLTTTLIPEDFMDVLNQPGPLTLVLDRSTAAIPWEMAAIAKPSGTQVSRARSAVDPPVPHFSFAAAGPHSSS